MRMLCQAQLVAAVEKVITYEHLDLGLARSVIRAARRHSILILPITFLRILISLLPR